MVTVERSCRDDPSRWQGVVERLKGQGLRVVRDVSAAGIVSGYIDPSKIAALKGEADIVSVELEQRRQIQGG